VRDVLQELGAGERPCLHVLNKADRLDPARREALTAAVPEAVLISARERWQLAELREQIAGRLGLSPRRRRLSFALTDGEAIAALHRVGEIHAQEIGEGTLEIDADVPDWFMERYRGHLL